MAQARQDVEVTHHGLFHNPPELSRVVATVLAEQVVPPAK